MMYHIEHSLTYLSSVIFTKYASIHAIAYLFSITYYQIAVISQYNHTNI